MEFNDKNIIFNEWKYFAEGNAHIIYQNVTTTTAYCNKFILRIPKKIPINKEINIQFLQNIMIPFFGNQSIDIPNYIALDQLFLTYLHNEIKLIYDQQYRHLTIASIRREWDSPVLKSPWTAECIPDAHNFYHNNINHSAILSFEFKIKGGLIMSSPFLYNTPSNIKLLHSRFSFMQSAKLINCKFNQATTLPGVSCYTDNLLSSQDFSIVSREYNPSDLYSHDESKIRKALFALIDVPGNLFTMRLDGTTIFGQYLRDKLEIGRGLKALLEDCEPSYEEECIKKCVEMLCTIFLQQKVLCRLEAMQAVDLLDVEGGDLVFQRLIELVGTEDEALEVMQKNLGEPFPFDLHQFAMLCLQKHRQLTSTRTSTGEPVDYLASDESNWCPSVLMDLLALQIHKNMSVSDIDAYYTAAITILKNLTMDDCVILLRLWLISLTAKDISVAVTLQRQNVHNVEEEEGSYSSSSIFFLHNNDDDEKIAYKISMMDVNCKPVTKLISKIQKEHEICMSILNNSCLS